MRWSKYNPYYLEPEVKKEAYSQPVSELSAKEKEERELKVVRPIKAATNAVTSSVFDDSKVRYLKTTLPLKAKNVSPIVKFCLKSRICGQLLFFAFQ